MPKKLSLMEKEWAIRKYSVLAKSQRIYDEIRELLKDKVAPDEERFFSLIREAYLMPDDSKAMANSFYHVFGYGKTVATTDEKILFLDMMDGFREGKVFESEIKHFLKKLAKRANSTYLLRSDYFQKKEEF